MKLAFVVAKALLHSGCKSLLLGICHILSVCSKDLVLVDLELFAERCDEGIAHIERRGSEGRRGKAQDVGCFAYGHGHSFRSVF